MKLVTAIIISVFAFSAAQIPAKAGTHAVAFGPNSTIVTPAASGTITFVDTLDTARLIINGGPLITDGSISFLISDFWTVSGTIVFDADVDDEIRTSINLTHTSQPHPAQDGGNGPTYTSEFVLLAENGPDDGVYVLSHQDTGLQHGAMNHINFFFNDRISVTIDTFPVFDVDDIDTFNITLNADHRVIPEPSTLALLSTGTLGLMGFGWRRRKRAA